MPNAKKIGGGSLALRLCTIALVPMLALGVTSFRQIARDQVAAEASIEFAETVTLQRSASSVIAPANLERIALEGIGRMEQLGVDPDLVVAFTGIDFFAVSESNRTRLDGALAQLAVDARDTVLEDGTTLIATLARYDAELARQRGLSAAQTSDPAGLGALFDDIANTLHQLLSGKQANDESAVVGLADAGQLQAIARAEASAGQLTQAVVRGLLDAGQNPQVTLIQKSAIHDAQLDTFGALLDQEDRARFYAVRLVKPVVPLELFPARAELDGSIITNPDTVMAIATFLVGQLDYLDSLDAYAADIQLDISDGAAARAVSATDDVRNSKLLLAAVALISSILTLFVLVTTGRPLARLSRRAAKVGQGDLTTDPLPLHGPSVVRRLTASVNDMLVTLAGVDRQIARLSAGDLSSADSVELPGAVGVSMRQSVARLSSMTEQLAHQARHDLLTSLPNRFAAMEHLDRLISRGQTFALLFLDIDGFKGVNDTHGHEAGDEVLREVARRLSGTTRSGELIARLGGDEFVIIVSDYDDIEAVMALGHRLIQEVEQPYGSDEGIFALSASVGVVIPDTHVTSLEALHQADTALYLAKHRGRGRVERFDSQLQEQIEHAADLALALRHGVRNGELVLHFQPIMSLATGRLDHVEALVRWDRPNIGMVSPGEFIPIAERSSLIFEIERWVLHRSCEAIADWEREFPDHRVRLAVNISGRHLIEGDLLGDLERALAATGANPSMLEFELTETHLLEDLEMATTLLNTIRALDITIAVDDFGTGYSSMNYLRDLPIDVLKIDRSFVARSTEGGYDSTVIEAVLTIARSLDLQVVAEGIETHEQLEYVRSVGCHRAQGYLLARPNERAEAERLLFGSSLKTHDQLRAELSAEVILGIDADIDAEGDLARL